MSKKAIYVRNKKRALRVALGRNERWVPEHERLNMTPIEAEDATEDFMNEKRRRAPIGSRKPPAAPVVGSGRTRAVHPNQEEQAWLPQGRPHQAPEKNYAQGEVPYDDVPSPPPRFEHPHRALGADLSGVLPGQYCLVYENEVWASSDPEEIETAVENIMRADPNVDERELMVFYRHNIKVGVTLGG